MMDEKLCVLISQMLDAATTAISYVDGYSKADFLSDKRTQQAVVLNILIIGVVATKIVQTHAEFAKANDAVPWTSMRNMRNRIAHGYYDIDLDVVWDTLALSLPPLVHALSSLRQ